MTWSEAAISVFHFIVKNSFEHMIPTVLMVCELELACKYKTHLKE